MGFGLAVAVEIADLFSSGLRLGRGAVGKRPSGLNLFSAVGDVTLAGFAGLQQSGWAQPVTALPDAGPASAMA